LLDVVGYNYQEQRYVADHREFPKRVIYGSENDDNYAAWRAVADNDFISGQFLWTGIDYLGEAGEWPARVFPGGVFDLAAFRKPDAWWRQALWNDKPVVYLAATQRQPRGEGRRRGFRRGGELLEQWNWSAASPVRVACATNCPAVDLYLNGELVDTLTVDDEQQGWRRATLDFAPGKLEAVGRDGDRELGRFALQTAGAPHHVQLDADATQLAADGRDVAHVTFTIVDEHGVRVPNAEHEVTFAMAGPVRLLGIENGRTEGDPKYQDERCEAYRGRGLAIFQSTRESGEAVIQATALGLEPAELRLPVQ
jgi:hypothetical protein